MLRVYLIAMLRMVYWKTAVTISTGLEKFGLFIWNKWLSFMFTVFVVTWWGFSIMPCLIWLYNMQCAWIMYQTKDQQPLYIGLYSDRFVRALYFCMSPLCYRPCYHSLQSLGLYFNHRRISITFCHMWTINGFPMYC